MSKINYIGKDGWFISFRDEVELKTVAKAHELGEIANPGAFSGEIDDFALRGADLDPLEDIFSQAAEYSDFG